MATLEAPGRASAVEEAAREEGRGPSQWGQALAYSSAKEQYELEEEMQRGVEEELAILAKARFANASQDRLTLNMEVPLLPENREWGHAKEAADRGDPLKEVRELRAVEDRTRSRLRVLDKDIAWLNEQLTLSARAMGCPEERMAEAAEMRALLHHQERARRRAEEGVKVDPHLASNVASVLAGKEAQVLREAVAGRALEQRLETLTGDIASLALDLRLSHNLTVRESTNGALLLPATLDAASTERPASAARKVRELGRAVEEREGVRVEVAALRARAVPGSLDFLAL
ncbi:hypothetical protein T484DRAFT_1925017 [Baffinella frigidus]|nr:hypothetical protein T484DRAFT_1925017 [Cryptophyta sp. CCMP2293]|mmetsp:Transcript_31948/g.75898  ORF Transcript_31948/g.75898 Transcript_31948/m.75898 type:complete len:288 (+) Transcript_31948:313-1176(+)